MRSTVSVLLAACSLLWASPDPADIAPAGPVIPPGRGPTPDFFSIDWYARASYPGLPMYRAMGTSESQQQRLYLIGGLPSGSPVADCWCYHVDGDSWARITSLPEANCNQWAVWWEDDGVGDDSSGIFVLGRYAGSYYKTCYQWTRATNTWSMTSVPEYPGVAFSGNMAAVIGDSIFLIHRNTSSTVEMHRYSIREGAWAQRATPAVNTNYYGSVCAWDGRIWQLGGWPFSRSFQVYQPGADQWTVLPDAPDSVGGNGPILVGHAGRIWAAGGGSQWTNCDDAASFDPVSSTWSLETPLPVRVGATPGVLLDSAGTVGIHWATGNSGGHSTLHYRGVPQTTGVAEPGTPRPAPSATAATVVRGFLRLPAPGSVRAAAGVLRDAAGRRVMTLAGGSNDVSGLAPGVYFVCAPEAAPRAVTVVR